VKFPEINLRSLLTFINKRRSAIRQLVLPELERKLDCSLNTSSKPDRKISSLHHFEGYGLLRSCFEYVGRLETNTSEENSASIIRAEKENWYHLPNYMHHITEDSKIHTFPCKLKSFRNRVRKAIINGVK
jgi:hypothetical protein